MYKQGAVIYFSGTGNTEYVAKLFKEKFELRNISIDLIDIQKYNKLDREYDFYIFGGPIHADMIPDILIDWIKNIKDTNKKCIIYSTLADKEDKQGRKYLGKVVSEKGFEVLVDEAISMPNNYYVVFFKRDSEEDIKQSIDNSKPKVEAIVNRFLEEDLKTINYSKKVFSSKIVYDIFLMYTKKFPKKKFSLDKDKCIGCNICEKNCPTNNISMNNKQLKFKNQCIGCLKCIHKCPANAILYKKQDFKQYNINKYI